MPFYALVIIAVLWNQFQNISSREGSKEQNGVVADFPSTCAYDIDIKGRFVCHNERIYNKRISLVQTIVVVQ